jgi:hypothetical protein
VWQSAIIQRRKLNHMEAYLTGNNKLVIRKSRKGRQFDILFWIIAIMVLLLVVVRILIKIGEKGRFSIPVLLVTFFILAAICVFGYYNIIRSRKKFQDFLFEKEESKVYRNGQFICQFEDIQNISIIRLTDRDGASTYNVNLVYGKCIESLSLDLSKVEAHSLANITAEYFETSIVIGDGSMICP